MSVIVIGSNGQLGSSLKYIESCRDLSFKIEHLSKKDLNINEFDKVNKYISLKKPSVIVNLSGFTDVDGAETHRKSAQNLNHLAVENLAQITKSIDATLIHISTDYVFNGNNENPYLESDKTDPIGVYGKTKLCGEISVIKSNCKYILLRTSWIFSKYGKNFLLSILKMIKNESEISIVNDQFGCPTYANDISKVIISFTNQILNGKDYREIFHYSGYEKTTWYDFANEILRQKKHFNHNIDCEIKPIKSCEYITPAKRPSYSVLDCSKIKKIKEIKLSDWRNAVKEVVADLS